MRRRAIVGVIAAAALTVSACSSDDAASDTAVTDTSSAETSAVGVTTADSSAETEAGEADGSFARGMIPHHTQAIEMAELALDPATGAGPEVQDLATRIRDAQGPEIELLTDWLGVQGVTVEADEGHEHDMAGDDGMMSDDQMAGLAASTGADFDTAWLELMIEHHEGAVAMALAVQTDGSSPEMLALADEIIAAQEAEIAEMQTLLDA